METQKHLRGFFAQEFHLAAYHLYGLRDATAAQLREYCKMKGLV